MRTWSWLAALVCTVVGLGLATAYAGSASGAAGRWGVVVPGDTVVAVTGSKEDGFEITRYDGTREFPPTDSEARAECSEYDTRVARVRCRTEVRTWYRDLGELQQALRWAPWVR